MLSRAPGRGRYDRALSRAARFREQYERLLVASAQAHLEGVETVSRVVALAGVGRSTFYECFDDFEHALRAVRSESAKRVQASLAAVTSQTATFDELSRAWVRAIVDAPLLAFTALQHTSERAESELGAVFERTLVRVVARARPELEPSQRLVMSLAVATAEACARNLAIDAIADERSGVAENAHDERPRRLDPDQVVRRLSESLRATFEPSIWDKL